MTSLLALSSAAKTSAFPRALVRLCARSQRELWGLRLTRLYGIGVGISYAILAFVLAPGTAVAVSLWARCLATASWVAGVGALSLARDLAARDALQGLGALSRLRGISAESLERARTLAGAIRLGSAVMLPGLLVVLALLARLPTPAGALTVLSLTLLTLPYAALLGAVLAVLARLCSVLLPGRGRLLFCAVVLGPWLMALGTHSVVPSIPGAFAWLLRHVAGSLR